MELYIPPIRIERNPTNGKWNKGITPHNKGKKWDDYLSKEAQERIRESWRNRKGKCAVAGWNKRPVIMIDKEGNHAYFESAHEAGRATGINYCNILHVCSKKRKTTGGCKWYYLDDEELIDILK